MISIFQLRKLSEYQYKKLIEEIIKLDIDIKNTPLFQEGIKEGKIEGIKEGKIEGIRATAIKMVKKKIDMEIIIEVTGLTENEILDMYNEELNKE